MGSTGVKFFTILGTVVLYIVFYWIFYTLLTISGERALGFNHTTCSKCGAEPTSDTTRAQPISGWRGGRWGSGKSFRSFINHAPRWFSGNQDSTIINTEHEPSTYTVACEEDPSSADESENSSSDDDLSSDEGSTHDQILLCDIGEEEQEESDAIESEATLSDSSVSSDSSKDGDSDEDNERSLCLVDGPLGYCPVVEVQNVEGDYAVDPAYCVLSSTPPSSSTSSSDEDLPSPGQHLPQVNGYPQTITVIDTASSDQESTVESSSSSSEEETQDKPLLTELPHIPAHLQQGESNQIYIMTPEGKGYFVGPAKEFNQQLFEDLEQVRQQRLFTQFHTQNRSPSVPFPTYYDVDEQMYVFQEH